MCFPAIEIERCRLESIAAAWHLIRATRAPLNSPSEWAGWSVVNPDANRALYHDRAAAKLCTRCGKHPPRPDRKTCEGCAEYAAARSADFRARRKAAGQCTDCSRPTTGGHQRCKVCRDACRGGD